MSEMNSECGVRGFFRLQIEENGKVVGDSGWRENLVTNYGFQQITDAIAGQGGVKTVSHVALGTGGAPIASDSTLSGEIMASTQRGAVTYAQVSSKTAQWTCTFASSASFITAASSISNLGLFGTTATNGSLLCGNTYTSSSLNTNQNCQITYQLRFSAILPFLMALLGAGAAVAGMI